MSAAQDSGPGAASRSAAVVTAERLLISAVFAAAILLCLPAVRLMPVLWERSEFYGHGYAIPAVALYLAYRERTRIVAALREPHPPAWGWCIALVAALGEVLLVVGDVGFLAGVGIPVVLGAAAVAVGGFALLQPLLLPLAFLALMVPPPFFLTAAALVPLKLLVTRLSVWLLQLSGYSVAAVGNQIEIPGQTLFVADACSGLTSMVTMLPLACIIAYFLSRGVWRRAAIIASVVPVAMIANVFRVVVTVQLVSSFGEEYAQGLLHEGFGMTTYVFGTLALVGLARVLR